ncbi:MAG: zinc-dependent peptidase [Azospira sp.]|jgi:Mlc titration factor MtfA (ptsG expression regulator)|nr:zinc-dependent peptidase [Azospira sp.]
MIARLFSRLFSRLFPRLFPHIFSRLFGRRPVAGVPDEAWRAIRSELRFLDWLQEDEWARLRALVASFLDAKEFTATGGLELDDRMKLSIAVQGCLPILNLGLDWYDGWVGIVVYPAEFVIPRSVVDEDGIVHEYDEVASGEAWGDGPLLVSWQDVEMAGDGYNVVIHEFVHKLDMLNGEADGRPPLHPGMSPAAWEKALATAYADFCARVDAGEDTTIDPYAAESPGEFFAVFAEAFFETPQILHDEYPAVYAQLAAFFRLDPLAAGRRAGTPAAGASSHAFMHNRPNE